MTMPHSASELNDQAAEWAIRAEEHGSDPKVVAALEAWLAEDPRRQGAFLRAQAALSFLDRGRALADPAQPVVVDRTPFMRAPFRLADALVSRRRLLIGGGVAGGAVAAGAAGLFILAQGEAYDTRLGEMRRVPLADGSVATINTDSQVVADLKPAVRSIKLAKGEAWFKVAHDPKRPFVVEAGDVRIRAIGTAFSVRRRDGGADVLVTEGVVDTWVVGQEGRKIRLAAGSRAFVTQTQPIQAVATAGDEIERTLAWRDGQIALYGETLADAATEFNRYNARKLVIADPQLASEKVVGQFSADDPEAFAKAAASTLGATYSDDGATLKLSRVASR
jgi:transmembrane sensor